MDPNEAKVVAGPAGGCEYFLNYTTATQFDPSGDLAYTKTYYWRVDTKVTFTGKTDPNEFDGPVWSFKTVAEDKAPIAQAGQSIRTWLAKAQAGTVQLQGSVMFAEDDSTAQWTAYKMPIPDVVPAAEVTFADATSPTTTVTITETGEYILQLTATDDDDIPGSPSVSQMKVIVYADACEAAKNTPGYAKDAYDFDGNCIVSLTDLATLAKAWLASTAATADIAYAGGTISDPEKALLVEYWMNINGTDPNAILNDPRYPTNPTGRGLVTGQFTQNTRNADNYGQRIRGYIVPPTTGNYIFYIASDDASRLFLSTDFHP
jgi:hypothetical protein